MTLLLLALLLPFQQIEIKPRFLPGDTFRVEVFRIRENSQRPQANGRSRTPVDMQVVSVGPAGSVVEWIPGPTVYENPLSAKDPMVAAAARAVEEIRFLIRLNPDGEFDGLENEAQVTRQLQSMTDTMLKQLLEGLAPAQRAQAESIFAQIFTPAVLISTVARDAQIFFGLNGISMAPAEVLEIPLDQQSPIGGGTLRAHYRIRLDSSTATAATVSTTTVYDPEALRSMTAALLTQAGTAVPSAELAAVTVQMSDEGRYLYDRTLGVMREAAVTRRLAAGPMQRLDSWTIRLVSGPKR